MAIPFLWMVSTSLKPPGSEFDFPPKWIPTHFEWSNYSFVLLESGILQGFFNTLLIISLPCLVGLFTSALAAYAFGRMQFPAKNLLFTLLLATMMIPGVVTMIPTFILFKNIGWIDSWLPLIVPGMFGGGCCGIPAAAILYDHSKRIRGCRQGGWDESIPDLYPHHAAFM